MSPGRYPKRDRGATAVEYGLLVGGVVAAFLIGAIALQGAVGAVLNQQTTHIEQNDTPPPAP
jgi:Flp pilus assembly pilin Flp